MPGLMETRRVVVEIVSMTSQTEPPGSRLEYEVRNETDVPIWLVDDSWLIWGQSGTHIELSYARGRMQPGAQVFGYFPPSVIKIEPSDRVLKTIQLEWPQPLDRLWNAEAWATPPTGECQVSVRVGYGLSPEPGAVRIGEGVEAPVFRWQKEAISQEVQMKVPPYRMPEAPTR